MKVLGVIPARYASSRFPGKALADIEGRPMIWWVYQRAKRAEGIAEIVVATDDDRIMSACTTLGMHAVMTSSLHKTSTERVWEVAKQLPADLYIVINGDEPLIEPEVISQIIPQQIPRSPYVGNLMTKIANPSEVVDCTNIKVVTDCHMNALFFSRSPIPYPKASLTYDYYKHVGVLIYDKAALQLFHHVGRSKNETVEDINELRFLDNGVAIHMTEVQLQSLSVDTPKDLDFVRGKLRI